MDTSRWVAISLLVRPSRLLSSKFLIDPDGKIVMKFIGLGEEPFEYLEEKLSEQI